MGVSSLVSLISKKMIKPSIPTPHRSHKLSFLDQLFDMSIPFAYFYPKNDNMKPYEPSQVSQLLEKSLSKALSYYYPYAGRIKEDGFSVDCNDMGVEVSDVRIYCPMSDILKHPYTDAEDIVFPQRLPWNHSEGNLASVQVSYFDCGGIAVGGCLSHKIGDGCTIGNFFYNWGVLSCDISVTQSPYFVGESIYPQSNDPSVVSIIKPQEPAGSYKGKRFVFPVAKINALKAKFSSDSGVQNPTCTEVVIALIYKCAVAAGQINKPSSLFQISYMRQRLNPPLSQDASGNIFSGFSVLETTKDTGGGMDCKKLVTGLRREMEKLDQEKDKETGSVFITEVVDSLEKGITPFSSNNDIYFCISLNEVPLYKTDFGWGRPARVSMGTGPFNKMFHLMDNQSGGGVEAIIMLPQQDMSIFEADPELLEFAIPSCT